MTLSSGSSFPTGVELTYIPIDLATIKQANALGCAKPFTLKVDRLIEQNADSNILFVSVPVAFAPTCTEGHSQPFLAHLEKLKKEKDISVLIILSANDPFVMNAWGKLLLQNADFNPDSELPKVIFASDPNAEFSVANGMALDLTNEGLGIRTGRYAFVVRTGTRSVVYYGMDPGHDDVVASSYETIETAQF
ncbi:Redoxin [Metschnikowia bicuspidata var. bicuspidata NRRL YB-4993]|uniref:Redoxin n=1 Tax=Metschnikowia bicuspidata var. bicuspidata NRRL YB-4993 TaxID=869754 RepID=A0A1A0HF82_9ASCO|nr:Redoxin [Metschnikowia bicuspidata var. bicuspidata NRRL YB-4993]OBA22656.1 Redoxin [Metschnikowia bicuspidata var. bicuspidata NRRL YB-4993]